MFNEANQFYPTPQNLVFKMLDKISEANEFNNITYILEPNCGKGDLVKGYEIYFNNKFNGYYNKKDAKKYLKFDAIEYDDNLSNLLRGEGFNVIWDDFLSFTPPRFYDLIIMNPPFINGSTHLIKALEIQERIGGKVLAIINADTLKNPYSKERQALLSKLQQYNADIEYIQEAFTEAERKTDVEIALIYVKVPMQNNETIFEKQFKRDHTDIHIDSFQTLMPKMNKLEALVFEYNIIKNSVIELFKEKIKIQKMFSSLNIKQELGIVGNVFTPKVLSVNEYINTITLEYWNKFINETDFKSKLPSKLRDNFSYNMERQQDIAFTIENIRYFYEELMKSIPQSYEETVAKVFDDLTNKWSYTDSSFNKTVHMYNGWKSNNCYKIVGKNIIPCYHQNYFYRLPDTLVDLNIIFNNMSGEKYNIDTKEIREQIEHCEKNIDVGHFLIDSYKKGTIHIKYKDQNLLNQFNILAGKGKAWLPPDFGTKPYSDMTDEEKDLVKEFGLTVGEYQTLNVAPTNYLRLMD